jgi:hypothetical protein
LKEVIEILVRLCEMKRKIKELKRNDCEWKKQEKTLWGKKQKFYCNFLPKLREISKKLPKDQVRKKVLFSCFYFPQLKQIFLLLRKKLSEVKKERKRIKRKLVVLLKTRKDTKKNRNVLLGKIKCSM